MLQHQTDLETQPGRQMLAAVPPAAPEGEAQRKRMMIALGILLLALVAVVLKDWDFWFPAGSEPQEASAHSRSQPQPVVAAALPAPLAPLARERKAPLPSVATSAPVEAPLASIVERTTLPPLQVEVVAGNRHTQVPGKSNAIRVDTNSASAAEASISVAPVVNASERVRLSPQTTQRVSVSVPPDYPLLARQMKVQGAVSLQALISRDGSIQELEILSGPGILAAAAREAVKQWHFKPYLQNGQPVETQARITVNFTISTN